MTNIVSSNHGFERARSMKLPSAQSLYFTPPERPDLLGMSMRPAG
jgi:hypothetical protein